MAKFSDILQAIRNEIVRLRVIDDINRIIPCARRTKVPKLTGEKDIILRVGNTQIVPSVEGQGRGYTRLRRIIEVIPRCRSALDEVGKDTVWLMDETLGFFNFEEALLDAVQLFQPTNIAETEFLADEPMRIVGFGIPDKDVDPDGKWGSETMMLEVFYKANLDQSRQ